jgi:hypothetical protein
MIPIPTKKVILLILLFLLSTPLAFANSDSDGHEHESEGVRLGVISGLVTFIFVASTVIAGRLMKKGKLSIKTHHTLAYITLTLALFHGIYNLFAH